jgi:hypothetical protein
MLAEVASNLGAKDVNILAFIGAVIEGRGAVRMIVDKPAAARKVLPTSAGRPPSRTS